MPRIISSLLRRFRTSLTKCFSTSGSRRKARKHRPKPRLFLINEFYGRRAYVTEMLDKVASSLNQRGIRVEISDHIAAIAPKVRKMDLAISHHIPPRGTPLPDSQVFGRLRTQRARGLKLLNKFGIDTVRWSTPANPVELIKLFHQWKTDTLLLKRAGTCRALGISMIQMSDVDSLQWGPHDVFCEVLRGSPKTIKVHFLGTTLLGCYFLNTPPVADLPTLIEYLEPFPTPEGDDLQIYITKGIHNRIQVDPRLAEKIRALGSKLLRMGGGYSSIDFMEGPEGWLAIELNSNTVGTLRPWVTWPQESHDALVTALEALVSLHPRKRRKTSRRKQSSGVTKASVKNPSAAASQV